jgi:hypothetical protein
MTDRINAYTVVLDRDVREDDAEDIATALRMVRGVLSVTPNVAKLGDYIAIERAKNTLRERLFAVVAESDK